MRMRTPIVALCLALGSSAIPSVTTPKQFFGHDIGADYELPDYTQLSKYWQLIAKQSNRVALETIGKSAEGRDQLMAIVSSPANIRHREEYRKIAERLARGEKMPDAEAKSLAARGKAIVWIDGGLHASEVLGAQQLMETMYQMVTREDEEARRIRDNVIILFVHANPDGMELCSDWYMQEKDPKKRNLRIPRLYQKYIGHDNNRDFYMASQPETQNMCRIMFKTWYPQIIYNHHQTGPRGTVLFCPPFRDPFNHNIDPQAITGTDLVGMAMHNRFLMEGKPGATMRSGSPYSTWWNGGLRTTAYFHNMIGILTETIGNPTPTSIPFVASKLSPQGQLPMPIEPQEWHFRQSIEYSLTANLAILDLAARQRDDFLYGIYTMARRQIALGSKDSWIDYPKRTALAESMADLREPSLRAARAYILSSDQPDFATAVKFANTMLYNGVVFNRAKSSFLYDGKRYPAGSLVVKCDQAFRPHVLDMFEPQDHPNDIPAPGAAPIPPYDSAGYTLAFQMGVNFVRCLTPVEGEFDVISDPIPELSAPGTPLCTINDSYKWAFEQLAKGVHVYQDPTTFSVAKSNEKALELKAPRVGLWDTYGGSMESGWDRFVFEKFSVPFKVLYPKDFAMPDLLTNYDVLVLPGGAVSSGQRRPGGGGGGGGGASTIPEAFQFMTGSIDDAAIANLRKFVEAGGTIISMGSSTALGQRLGLGLSNHLVVDGKALPREKFYVPGSVVQVTLEQSNPVTWGCGPTIDAMFDNSPTFKVGEGVTAIGTFKGEHVLRSGWAWGEKYLADGVPFAEAKVGKGTVFFFGPELNHRGQSHATFKLLFNAILHARQGM